MEVRAFNDTAFHAYLSERQLMGSRCVDCQTLFVPPRSMCVSCRSWELEWEQVTGTGTIVALTNMSFPTPALSERGYGPDNPYCAGVVELDEGARVVAQIETVNDQLPAIGMPVVICFDEGESEAIVTFRLV